MAALVHDFTEQDFDEVKKHGIEFSDVLACAVAVYKLSKKYSTHGDLETREDVGCYLPFAGRSFSHFVDAPCRFSAHFDGVVNEVNDPGFGNSRSRIHGHLDGRIYFE
jgi:hypothetical protein